MTIQISAHISPETKKELDAFVRERGLKKNFVIERALLHFLQASREIPQEMHTPPHIVLEKESFDALVDKLENPDPPTDALVELMNGR